MRNKVIITILFLALEAVLYYFGSCDLDFTLYLVCIVLALVFLLVSYYQMKKETNNPTTK